MIYKAYFWISNQRNWSRSIWETSILVFLQRFDDGQEIDSVLKGRAGAEPAPHTELNATPPLKRWSVVICDNGSHHP